MSAALLRLALAFGLSQGPSMPQAEVAAARKLEKDAHELQRAGRYADAEKPLRAAIALWTKYRGAEDIETLNDTMSLAVALRRKGDAAGAIPLLEKTAEALGRSKDPDAPEVRRKAINNLASAYRYAGRVKQAQAAWEGLLKQLQTSSDDGMAEERARVLDNLAGLLFDDAHDVPGAERYARQGYATWRALRGDGDDPDVAISGSILASIAASRGDTKEARRLLEDALRVHESFGGPDNPNVAATLNLLSDVEVAEGHRDAARAALRRSLAISGKLKLDPRHYLIVEAQNRLKTLDAPDAGRR